MGASASSLVHQFKHSASQRSTSGGQKYAASGSQAPHFSSSASPRSGRVQLSSWNVPGRWDGGTEARQVFLDQASHPGGKLFSCCIHLKPPQAREGEKGPLCFLAFRDPPAMAQISSAGAHVSPGAFGGNNNLGFLLRDRRHTSVIT